MEALWPSTLRLGDPLPAETMRAVERTLQLHHFKWDTQVGDTSVLLPQPLLLSENEWTWLAAQAEQAAREIYGLEQAVAGSRELQSLVGVPRPLRPLLAPGAPPDGLRTMRFDFHPTATGWMLSEVNTDVPGGYAEASTLPALFAPFCPGMVPAESPLKVWGDSARAVVAPGEVALLCAPGYLEDQQVVLTLGRELRRRGFVPHVVHGPEALCWRAGRASLAWDHATRFCLVVRFFQAEWLAGLPARTGWRELFKRPTITRVTNPPESVISESKRLPLAFGSALAPCDFLRRLFPECREPAHVRASEKDGWVLKAAYSNTGDAVYLGAEHSPASWVRLLRQACKHPAGWVAQRRFQTVALASVQGPVRPCVGVFVIGERAAGAYVRLARGPLTDAYALEAPLLIVPNGKLP